MQVLEGGRNHICDAVREKFDGSLVLYLTILMFC